MVLVVGMSTTRHTIRLSAREDRALRSHARAQGISNAALWRNALAAYLGFHGRTQPIVEQLKASVDILRSLHPVASTPEPDDPEMVRLRRMGLSS
jgi:hypothetical protein